MADDWSKRFEAAKAEMKRSHIIWNQAVKDMERAEKSMAHAAARQKRAEREWRRVFQEQPNKPFGAGVFTMGKPND